MSSFTISGGKYINDKADIKNKVVIITGSNAGIGRGAAIQLAKRGGKIYFACRSEERASEAIKEAKEASGNENLHFLKLDLSSLDSVREFSKKFHELENRLDILINNAGVLSPLERTSDGFELNFGVNHLGHFLLTNLLLDLLKVSAPSRIIVVSSVLHHIGNVNRDDLNSEKNFSGPWKSYANSKLCNNLFMRELSKKLEGTGVVCNALCPGTVNTDVIKSLNRVTKFLMAPIMYLFYSTPEIGAQTILMLAVEPSVANDSGNFYIKMAKKEPSDKSKDDDTAKWLWDKSVELTKLNDF